MSTVGELENAIVARLSVALTLPGQAHPKVDVRAWPERPRDYRMAHPHGAALVIYRGSKFTHRATAGQLVPYEDEFELGLVSRTLRDAPGTVEAAWAWASDLLQTCRETLMGWVPQFASGQVRVISIEFDDYVEGTWGYSLRFAIPMTTVANRPRPPAPGPSPTKTTPLLTERAVQLPQTT